MSGASVVSNVFTVRRLLAIKRGEVVRYYLGDLGQDIATAAKDVPTYRSILEEIRSAVEELARRGRVELLQETVVRTREWISPKGMRRKQQFHLTGYIARGL